MEVIKIALNVDTILISIIINVLVLTPVLWIAGRILVGGSKAKFIDALWIVVLGTVIGAVFSAFVSGIIASIILLIMWLGLIKHFFDCGWLKALIISIVAVVIFAVTSLILGIIVGIAIFTIGV
ncbi:hypothetical protein MUO66_08675 [Candidatus Bathyarchaeota archaeon]|nr:hypothetical protein [Candidatus Bathyarchaeota archaeon]